MPLRHAHRTRRPFPWGWLVLIPALALLVMFWRVVSGGVTQGAARRAAVVQASDALWRCNTLPGRQARDDCRIAQR